MFFVTKMHSLNCGDDTLHGGVDKAFRTKYILI